MERVYTIPLRKAYRAPKTKRANKAIRYVRSFLQRHMKTDAVLIGQSINEIVWKNSMANPPRKIKIHVEKDNEGIVRAEMFGVPIKKDVPKKEKVKEAPKEEKAVKAEPKKDETKAEVKKETPKVEAKVEKKPKAKVEKKAAAKKVEAKPEKKKVKAETKAVPKKAEVKAAPKKETAKPAKE